jgi:hypothetical protein
MAEFGASRRRLETDCVKAAEVDVCLTVEDGNLLNNS